ncbi:hypothetical protein BD324DRAFT_284753 [Kockovaella imperatae]|uniref:Uncharacterized protein n=1 Tax=Kockovaella imperatae TaxID=4999 RepID=A0A1Y1U5V6_9TREE|nr:hypothetical protein BD324DRAFT_284753 [Kockovaella imperatae]ORX33372.1 hypothetical protein BD324DRAFT_284753 [Kockovaella imperatae]
MSSPSEAQLPPTSPEAQAPGHAAAITTSTEESKTPPGSPYPWNPKVLEPGNRLDSPLLSSHDPAMNTGETTAQLDPFAISLGKSVANVSVRPSAEGQKASGQQKPKIATNTSEKARPPSTATRYWNSTVVSENRVKEGRLRRALLEKRMEDSKRLREQGLKKAKAMSFTSHIVNGRLEKEVKSKTTIPDKVKQGGLKPVFGSFEGAATKSSKAVISRRAQEESVPMSIKDEAEAAHDSDIKEEADAIPGTGANASATGMGIEQGAHVSEYAHDVSGDLVVKLERIAVSTFSKGQSSSGQSDVRPTFKAVQDAELAGGQGDGLKM